MIKLEPWVETVLADPLTKASARSSSFYSLNGVLDARVFLKNTHGYSEWAEGQHEYETLIANDFASTEEYREEIERDRPVYSHFRLSGRILDCGGGVGTVREFLPEDIEFVSIDPWIQAPFVVTTTRSEAYTCLTKPLNFIAATAEFIPFVAESFDWVHMRSMLDHVQVPDLAILEAKRVLRSNGKLLVGLYVEGGKDGHIPVRQRIKEGIKLGLATLGIERWKDHHVWHPTYRSLCKLITDNGLLVEDTFWQSCWNNKVCYVCARKP